MPFLSFVAPGLEPATWVLLATYLIVAVAAFAHGFIGLGFPMITTPCLALLTDLRTAVIVSVLPNIAVNIVSIARGGRWAESIGQHWRLAIYVFLGSLFGTQLLVGLPTDPLKLGLAAMIVVSLNINRIKRLDWQVLLSRRRLSEACFGTFAGILSGTVNVSVPPLAIYFMGLQLSPLATVQVFNLCFIIGKLTQAASLGAAGLLGWDQLAASVPLAIVALLCLRLGMGFGKRLSPAAYRSWLDRTLWVMAGVLVAQVALS